MSKKKLAFLIIDSIITIFFLIKGILHVFGNNNSSSDYFTKFNVIISKLNSEKVEIKKTIYQFRKIQFLDQLDQEQLVKFRSFKVDDKDKSQILEDYFAIYFELIEVEKQLEDSFYAKYHECKNDEFCYKSHWNDSEYQTQKKRFDQIKNEIENYNYLMTIFFNLYLDINNNRSDDQSNSHAELFNQKFVELFECIENKSNDSFLDKKIQNLELDFGQKLKKNPDRFRKIIVNIQENFYGQTQLINNFKLFITKQQKINTLPEKRFFALVGCPHSGKTTFVKTVTESLNLSTIKSYYFDKISVFDVLRAKFSVNILHQFKLSDAKYEIYVTYLKHYLLEKMLNNVSEKMVVLLDLDQVKPTFFDYFITSLTRNKIFDNLIVFLSFSSSNSFTSYQYVNQFDVKIEKNIMQTYKPSHMFDIFNRVLIPKKVDEFKNNIFHLLKKKQITNNDITNDDELRTKIFANFNITVYGRKFLFPFISNFVENKVHNFDSNCYCEVITNQELEKIAGKIVNISTTGIYELLSSNEISLDYILNVFNLNVSLKENEYKDFILKERNNYKNVC